MKKITKTVLVILSIFIILVLAGVISFLSKYVPRNPDTLLGNTAGNLNNGGYFCEDSDGTVYFANFYDNGTLYAMDADESNIRKLSDIKISSLNCDNHHLYYYMPDSMPATGLGFVRKVVGVYRCTKKASSITTLSREPAGTILLSGNRLLFQNLKDGKKWNLTTMDTTGNDMQVLMNKTINPASCHNGILYYANTADNHFLCSYDTITGAEKQLLKYNVWNPVYVNGSIYFMDIENDYRLCAYSLASDELQIITDDRIDFFNVTPYYIYYQKSSETAPALKRIGLDGSNEEVVAEGTYHRIHATSQYIYFQEFNDAVTIYHTPITGPVRVNEFLAAAQAVPAE